MAATIINCLTVIIGSLIGLVFHARIKDSIKEVVFISSGFIALVVGFSMALGSQSYLIVLFSLTIGGVVGYLLNINHNLHSVEKKAANRTSECRLVFQN